MNYPAFTNDSLTMMYEGVRGSLAADDAAEKQGEEPRFRIRETSDWKKHALGTEMLKRGMFFEAIDRFERQGKLRSGERGISPHRPTPLARPALAQIGRYNGAAETGLTSGRPRVGEGL